MGNKPVTYNFDGRPMVELSEHAELDLKLEIAIAALEYTSHHFGDGKLASTTLDECATVCRQALQKICPDRESVCATDGKRIFASREP